MSYATRLVLLAEDPAASSPCLLLDASGRILERRMLSPAQPAAPAPTLRTVVAVPGEQVRTLRLELPLRNPAQARAAALLQLEGELAEDAEPHIALGDVDADGRRLACVATTARMQSWLAQLEALGIVADVLLPDHLLVSVANDAPDAPTRVLAFEGRRLVRGPALAFTAEAGLAEAMLAGRSQHPAISGEDALVLLAGGALQPPLDLQQYRHARRRGDDEGSRRMRRLRLLAAALIASPLVLVAADALRHEISAQLLRQRTPPLAAVDAQLAQLHGTSGFNGLSVVLMRAVQARPDVRIESIDYEGGQLRALLAHADAASATAVLEATRANVGNATLEAVESDATDLRSRIVLEDVR